MALEFITTDYEFSHNHTPRGRGSWAFCEGRNPDCTSNAILWSPSMTYSEAKAWARREFKRRHGVVNGCVYVLS